MNMNIYRIEGREIEDEAADLVVYIIMVMYDHIAY